MVEKTSLIERLRAAGSIKGTGLLSDSTLFNAKIAAPTNIPIINVALSGRLDGGITSGLTMIAGPSKHFKSMLGLLLMKAYMDKYPESIVMFYDSEFGINPKYIKSFGIDASRIEHIPIVHLEQLKFDIAKRLEAIVPGDKVFFFLDSIGNLASKKEAEDAVNENSAADMSRARVIKSLFRIITPHFTIKDIPCVVINHIYMEMGLFPKAIVGGGQGPYLSSNDIWIIGRSQDKDGKDIVGWNFTINIEKSRYVKEKAKLTFNVSYEDGIDKWSGLLDIALAGGWVTKPNQLWHTRPGVEGDKKWRESETSCKEFWLPIISDTKFQRYVIEKYRLPDSQIVEETDQEIADIYNNLEE